MANDNTPKSESQQLAESLLADAAKECADERSEFLSRCGPAIDLAAELSGWSREEWVMHFTQAQLYDVSIDPAALRHQSTSTLANYLLAHVGRTPPEELTREMDRRLATLPLLRSDRDEVLFPTADLVDRFIQTVRIVQRVVAALDPARNDRQ